MFVLFLISYRINIITNHNNTVIITHIYLSVKSVSPQNLILKVHRFLKKDIFKMSIFDFAPETFEKNRVFRV